MARDVRIPVGVDIALDIVEEVDAYVARTGVTKRLVYESALRAWLLEQARRGSGKGAGK